MRVARSDGPQEVVFVRHRATYPIVGSTAAQLVEAIARLGPTRGGRRYPAYTDWELAWTSLRRQEGGAWRVGAASVTATVTTTLPRWHRPSTPDRSLVGAWEDYVAALEAHEEGHVALVEPTARALHAALVQLPAASSQAALDALVSSTAERLSAQHRASDVAYDRCAERVPDLHGAAKAATRLR